MLAAEWMPASSEMESGDALASLARRYFDSHSPATPADLARWANLTAADTKQAVAEASPSLTSSIIEDTEYLLGSSAQDKLSVYRDEAEEVVALPPFDELIFGYRDHTLILPDKHSASVFPHHNGIPRSIIILGGQVVATWKPPPRGTEERLVSPHSHPSPTGSYASRAKELPRLPHARTPRILEHRHRRFLSHLAALRDPTK